MENSSNSTRRRSRRAAERRADRAGKITIVTIIAILGLIVLAGFVGNAGHVVTNKVATQNAADAIAFSSAQWMARGMNASTATNHLLGEVTGLVVAIEGLGGPEADLKMKSYPPQSKIPDTVNQKLAGLAYIRGLPIYGCQAAGAIDKILVEAIVTKLISKKSNPEHKAFATIYDGKVLLKRKVTNRLLGKFFANWGFLVPPPWGYISAGVAYAVHIKCNIDLIDFGMEWVYLHAFELFVTTGGVVEKLKVGLLEDRLIPALAAHGDYLAGRKRKNTTATESAVVNEAIRDTLEHLGKVYKVKGAIYPTATTYPAINTLRLPIEAEPAPTNSGTRAGSELPAWGSDKMDFEDPGDQLKKAKEDIKENQDKIRKNIAELEQQIAALRQLETQVDDLKKEEGITAQERVDYDKEKSAIAGHISKLEALLAERRKKLQQLIEEEKEMDRTVAELGALPDPNVSGNISAKREHLALTRLNQNEERTTQWVRASYPYVDAFRAPILKFFTEHCNDSKAPEQYKKWTNRYTLIKSWKFRSGYRFKKQSDEAGTWSKDANTDLLKMNVMVETFDPAKATPPPAPGARRVAKGEQVWTKDTAEGKKMAENMFTVLGMTHREIEPLFSPVIYPVASRGGMTTFAQAIYYNGNEQKPATGGQPTTVQPKVGWDTLNWDPKSSPPEWGAEATVPSEEMWPWEIFTSNPALVQKAGVHLNWQAKLMPVTKSRILPAAAAAGLFEREPDMGLNVAGALPVFDTMVNH